MKIIMVPPEEGTLQVPWPSIPSKLLPKESSCCGREQRIVCDKQVQAGRITNHSVDSLSVSSFNFYTLYCNGLRMKLRKGLFFQRDSTTEQCPSFFRQTPPTRAGYLGNQTENVKAFQ
jgi:hypothetical protein